MTEPTTQRISRRNIVKGAAWAAPVVAMASAAPAFAASQPDNTSINGVVGISGKCRSQGGISVDIDSRSGSYGLFVNNTTTSTTISDAYIIFYLSVPGLSWSTAYGNDGWTAPVSTGMTKVVGTRTLYGYKTTYTKSITASRNRTALGNIHVTATGGSSCPNNLYALGERHVTVNGEEKVYDNGVTTLYLGGWGARSADPQSEGTPEAQSESSAAAQSENSEKKVTAQGSTETSTSKDRPTVQYGTV
ncbi:MAG: hypothetical protein SOH99_08140 [Acidipropionibacterium acidipropionici]|jgi:hypothetical protein|uniref:hypothetical protein n=1 Tax=Acidipropionibacterium acidipropionici TaxID=1748 RepID=UPI002F357E2E